MLDKDAAKSLRDAQAVGKLVPVVGAGVSMSAANLPSWRGLIESGLAFAEGTGAPTAQLEEVRSALAKGMLTDAARELKALLRAPGGVYQAWLETVFESPEIVSSTILGKIADLLSPIVATTNYDDLLERTLLGRYESVTWRQVNDMLRTLKIGNRVLHLHGLYRDPTSIVFGTDNYDELTANRAYRSVLQTLWIDRTLLFIGCSLDGLQDPDFSRMISWFSTTFLDASHRHFALIPQGSCTAAQQAAWLHDYHIQVLPYGPTHEKLPDILAEINANRDQAFSMRARQSRSLIDGHRPGDLDRFVSGVAGIARGAASEEVKRAAAILFDGTSNRSARERENFAAMQALVRSIVDESELRREYREWNRYRTRFEGRFQEAVRSAAAALHLFDEPLLNLLKRRRIDVHANVLSGQAGAMLKELVEQGDHATDEEEATDPRYTYQVENMHRIVGTVLAILDAAPADVFPTPKEGLALGEYCDDLLLVARHDRLELRRAGQPEIQAARLPLGQRIAGASFQRLAGQDVVVAHGADSVVAWNPQLTIASAEFRVDGAYGIESADHREIDGQLVSLVATIDRQIHRLEDLQPAGSWRCRGDIPSDVTLLADGRVFFLQDKFPIVELRDGRFVERLTDEQLLAQILSDPVLGRHWNERIAEETAHFGKPWPSPLDQRFQHVHLQRANPGDGELLSLRMALSFHLSDGLVVLLDPKQETLAVAGHFLVPARTLADYRIRPGGLSTAPRLVGVLLSEGEPEEDLAIWATAARTARGLMFARTGSTLRTDDDLIEMTCGGGDICYAADDSGGLFQFSMADGQWREIDRDRRSPIVGLAYKAASAVSAALE